MKLSSAFLLSSLLLVSCSGQKNPGSSSSSSAKKVQEISDTTRAEIEDSLASDEGKVILERKFSDLIDGKTEKGEKLDQKTKKATDFLGSYYFDLWIGSANAKDRTTRETLFVDAAHEFMDRLLGLTGRFNLSKISPLYDIRNQNDEFAFYAISIAMEKNLQKLLELALIAERNKKDVDAQLEVFVLPEHKNLTVALFQAQMNIKAALALKILTNNAKSNFGQGIEGLVKAASFAHLKNLDVPEMLVADDQILVLLKSSLKTKKLLQSLGAEASLEKNLKSSFRHVKEEKTRTDLMLLIKEIVE